MLIKSRRDFISGVGLGLTGAAFAVGSLSYDFGSRLRPGPGYFPFGLGVLLAVLGVAIAVTALCKASPAATQAGDPVGAIAWRPLTAILGAIVVFGAGLPHLGLFITLPLTIVTASLASDEFRWRSTLLSAAVLTLGAWLIFVIGLGLVIPVLPTFSA